MVVLDAVLVVLVVERRKVVRLLRLLRQRHVVALRHGVAPYFVAELLVVVVLPPLAQRLVDVGLADAALGLVAVQLIEWGVVVVAVGVEQRPHAAAAGHTGVVHLRFVVDDVRRRGVVHGVKIGLRRDKPVGVHAHRRLVGLALLRGEHDDAVGGQCTVDAGGCGILQHRHRLHVVGVDFVEVHVGGHVVDYNQRLGTHAVREGAYTAQYRVALARVGIDVHAQTGHLALQGRDQVLVHHAVQLRGVHKSEGRRRPFAAQPLVTCRHHHRLGQLGGLLLHLHVEYQQVLHRCLVRLHAHVAEHQHGVLALNLDAVFSVQVSHGGAFSAFRTDGDTIERLPVRVGHGTRQRTLCRCSCRCKEK